MRYIKWLYLAIWALIYQLPKKTVIAFSALIIVTTVFLFSWLITSTHFVVGPVHAVHNLPGNQNIIVEISTLLSQSTKVAVLDILDAPDDLEAVVWFLGYGEKQYPIGERSLVLLDSFAVTSGATFIELKDGKKLFNYLKEIPSSALVGGILLVLFGMVALQVMTSIMLGILTLVSGWHILYVGNFLDIWLLSDFIIYPVSGLIGVAGAAIGMRSDVGWTAKLFHRVAAIVLVFILLPLFTDQFEIAGIPYLHIISLLLTVFFPYPIYMVGGAALIAQGLNLNISESVSILILCLVVGLWLRSHTYPQRLRSYRPFTKKKAM